MYTYIFLVMLPWIPFFGPMKLDQAGWAKRRSATACGAGGEAKGVEAVSLGLKHQTWG